MKIVFRADASLQIGSGHVMRCLTLADALRQNGAECHFLCRDHPGHLIELVRGKGHVVHVLPYEPENLLGQDGPAHAAWLGGTQEQDVQACLPTMQALQPDWLIVDHYALDARWELVLKPYCQKMMVIDDLADRLHVCDLLLDQTYGRQSKDYRDQVPADCQLLCGSRYVLLRPEFALLRPYSLQRRDEPKLCRLLITMGGVDKENVTGQVLEALRVCTLPMECRITVVMGETAPWLGEVESLAQTMPWPTQIKVGVRDMAQIMADSDLAIGAAGATAWERCCLGLPSIMLVLAENQYLIARALFNVGAAYLEDRQALMQGTLIGFRSLTPEVLALMSNVAASLVDGLGAARVVDYMIRAGSTCE